VKNKTTRRSEPRKVVSASREKALMKRATLRSEQLLFRAVGANERAIQLQDSDVPFIPWVMPR